MNGTLNVLKACAKSSSVKRVVLTSSMAAVMCNGKPLSLDTIIDETWFSDPDVCKQLSKVCVEYYFVLPFTFENEDFEVNKKQCIL